MGLSRDAAVIDMPEVMEKEKPTPEQIQENKQKWGLSD